jgi:predicted N-formylglutamate amidohydrolase
MTSRSQPQRLTLVLTCEHASAHVPADSRRYFQGAERWLGTHRAFDVGALEFANHCAQRLQAPLFAGTVTRLLIDLNRSLDQADLWSSWSRELPQTVQRQLVANYYRPLRESTERAIRKALRANSGQAPQRRSVLHLSVHSFAPVLRGSRRDLHVALLFDPRRTLEVALARRWRRELERLEPRLKVAFNQPYRGTDDGHTTALRRRFPDPQYAGIELEINQRFPRRGGARWRRLQAHLTESLAAALGLRRLPALGGAAGKRVPNRGPLLDVLG